MSMVDEVWRSGRPWMVFHFQQRCRNVIMETFIAGAVLRYQDIILNGLLLAETERWQYY